MHLDMRKVRDWYDRNFTIRGLLSFVLLFYCAIPDWQSRNEFWGKKVHTILVVLQTGYGRLAGIAFAALVIWLDHRSVLKNRLPETKPNNVPATPETQTPTKLVIRSAFYGTGPSDDKEVTEKLAAVARDALVVPVDNNFLGCDPAPMKKKRLEVEYSYGNLSIFKIARPEGSRLVLPEDSEILRLTGELEQLSRRLKEAPGQQETPVSLTPSEGQSDRMFLAVKNLGPKQRFHAQCRIMDLRNDPNPPRRVTVDLRWQLEGIKDMPIIPHESCNLVVASTDFDGREGLVWMKILGVSEQPHSKWIRGQKEPLPEFDLEISVFGDKSERPHVEQFTLRPGRHTALEMVSTRAERKMLVPAIIGNADLLIQRFDWPNPGIIEGGAAYIVDLGLFIRATVSVTDKPRTVKQFELQLTMPDGVSYRAVSEHDVGEYYYTYREQSRDQWGNTSAKSIHEPMEDLAKKLRTPLLGDTHADGWLRFELKDVRGGHEPTVGVGHTFRLHAVDARGDRYELCTDALQVKGLDDDEFATPKQS